MIAKTKYLSLVKCDQDTESFYWECLYHEGLHPGEDQAGVKLGGIIALLMPKTNALGGMERG